MFSAKFPRNVRANSKELPPDRMKSMHDRIESKESEMIMQAVKQAILDSRAAIARAEALIILNEQKLATSEKRRVRGCQGAS